LRTHVEGLGGVVSSVLDGEWWLWCSKTVLPYWWSSEGDLLVVGYVVSLGVGSLEGAIVEGGNELLGCGQGGKKDGQLKDNNSGGCHIDGSLDEVSRWTRGWNVKISQRPFDTPNNIIVYK
jgi:hypothetical protein